MTRITRLPSSRGNNLPSMKRLVVGLATAVLLAGSVAGVAPRYRPGPARWFCAAECLARLSGRQPIRPMSLVPRGSTGADGQSPRVPSGLGREYLPHLLVRLFRPGQRRPQYLGWRTSTSAASTSAARDQLPVPTLVSVIPSQLTARASW
jgi:hypothetical protein